MEAWGGWQEGKEEAFLGKSWPNVGMTGLGGGQILCHILFHMSDLEADMRLLKTVPVI